MWVGKGKEIRVLHPHLLKWAVSWKMSKAKKIAIETSHFHIQR